MEILFDIRSESKKRVKNFHLGLCPFLVLLDLWTIKNLEQGRQDRGKERSEFSVQGRTQRLNKGDQRELERHVLPQIGNQPEHIGHVIPDVLLDNPH